MNKPRIAVLGLFGECNVLVPAIPAEDYSWMSFLRGEEIDDALADKAAFLLPEVRSFASARDGTGDWELVPILIAISESGPPLEDKLFRDILGEIEARLHAAGPLDGIYVAAHGAMRTDETLDVEGALLAGIRDIVGDAVPVIATLDLHGKLSPQMMSMSDLLIGYRTNPHVDMAERGEEAALAMFRMLAGERPARAFVRVPILLPQVLLSTTRGPFSELVESANAKIAGEVANITVLGGFSLTDTPFSGINISVATWGSMQSAKDITAALGELAWSLRDHHTADLFPLQDAVKLAVETGQDKSLPALCYADIADNPGGGGRGNTTFILSALYEAGAKGVAIGPFWDPAAVEQAHQAGLNATLDAELNTLDPTEFAQPFTARARVLGLSDGKVEVIWGTAKNVMLDHGPMAALEFDGIIVVVTTHRFQALTLAQFESVSVDPRKMRTVVVKSRGHFRAHFEEVFAPEQIYEIDAPGLTTADLRGVDFKNIQRPIIPFDRNMSWNAKDHVQVASR
jgi:microcystin degradation protein MlrC